jgi:hypothetical protein
VPQAASRARKRLDPSEEGPTLSQLIFASGSWLSREAFEDLERSSLRSQGVGSGPGVDVGNGAGVSVGVGGTGKGFPAGRLSPYCS